MKIHIGGNRSLVKGAVYSTITLHKLNTKNITEAELMDVDNLMPMILWTWYFPNAQGCEVGASNVYQDNQSAMLELRAQ